MISGTFRKGGKKRDLNIDEPVRATEGNGRDDIDGTNVKRGTKGNETVGNQMGQRT